MIAYIYNKQLIYSYIQLLKILFPKKDSLQNLLMYLKAYFYQSLKIIIMKIILTFNSFINDFISIDPALSYKYNSGIKGGIISL